MENKSGGIGFCSLLLIVFIVLKLVGTIDWSWWWVLSPFWIPACLSIVLFILLFLYSIFQRNKYKKL